MKHFILPDTQIRPGDNTDFLERIGRYVVDKKPDVFVQIGDFADLPSLSSWDIGKRSFEGRRYRDDVEAVKNAMDCLLKPIRDFNNQARKNGKKQYKPRMVLTLGNHCDRITRATNNDPKLDGTISIDDLGYEAAGWEVHPFLETVVIDSICYSHYHVSGVAGRPINTAQLTLAKKHMSTVAGHLQGFQMATAYRADGVRLTSIIAGSCYEHNEDYMGPQGNKQHWRGCIMLNDVQPTGEFDIMPVSLKYINEHYA